MRKEPRNQQVAGKTNHHLQNQKAHSEIAPQPENRKERQGQLRPKKETDEFGKILAEQIDRFSHAVRPPLFPGVVGPAVKESLKLWIRVVKQGSCLLPEQRGTAAQIG